MKFILKLYNRQTKKETKHLVNAELYPLFGSIHLKRKFLAFAESSNFDKHLEFIGSDSVRYIVSKEVIDEDLYNKQLEEQVKRFKKEIEYHSLAISTIETAIYENRALKCHYHLLRNDFHKSTEEYKILSECIEQCSNLSLLSKTMNNAVKEHRNRISNLEMKLGIR